MQVSWQTGGPGTAAYFFLLPRLVFPKTSLDTSIHVDWECDKNVNYLSQTQSREILGWDPVLCAVTSPPRESQAPGQTLRCVSRGTWSHVSTHQSLPLFFLWKAPGDQLGPNILQRWFGKSSTLSWIALEGVWPEGGRMGRWLTIPVLQSIHVDILALVPLEKWLNHIK